MDETALNNGRSHSRVMCTLVKIQTTQSLGYRKADEVQSTIHIVKGNAYICRDTNETRTVVGRGRTDNIQQRTHTVRGCVYICQDTVESLAWVESGGLNGTQLCTLSRCYVYICQSRDETLTGKGRGR